MIISPLNQASTILQGSSVLKPNGGDAFKAILDDMLQQAGQTEQESKQSTMDIISGTSDNLHSHMIALEKADLALQLVIKTRNKVVEAYQEIMRMQV